MKYLEKSRAPDFKLFTSLDPQLDETLGKEEFKRYVEFLGKRNKKYAEFLGKRISPDLSEIRAKRAFEFLGKRHMEFLGKRNINSYDKRTMEFLGKRAMEFLGKRGMEFLGRRSHQRRAGDWIG